MLTRLLTAAALTLSLAAPAMAQQQPLDEPTVKSKLEQMGYSNVGEVERVFHTTASQDGSEVSLLIDAQSGMVRSAETGQITEASARQLLEQEGYSEVAELSMDGGQYKAQATKDGQQQAVVIDAESGEIQPQD